LFHSFTVSEQEWIVRNKYLSASYHFADDAGKRFILR
jgi:hypothetical protein